MNSRRSFSMILTLALLAGSLLGAGSAAADTSVLVPYGVDNLPTGTTGFKYQILPLNSDIAGFQDPLFDDSAWLDGVTPFGGPGNAAYACSWLWPNVQTAWSPNSSDLFVRFHLDLCPGTHSVSVGTWIDNDLALYVNGVQVSPNGGCVGTSGDGLCQTEQCASRDKVTFDVPNGLLAAGDNVFAIHARDREIVAYLDVEVLGDVDDADCTPPTPPNDPPACAGAFADPGQLWPPNHKWKAIAIGGVTDPDGDEVVVTIDSILQDEPVDAIGNGDGNTCPDGDGVGTGSASVRAERAGGGDGRVYHIGFTATDASGDTCQGTVAVCVPHDQGNGNECIDQGGLFDSTVCP